MSAYNQVSLPECKVPSVGSGRLVSGSTYKGYRVRNHGYYAPGRGVWWEAINPKTGDSDFHAHTLRELRYEIDSANLDRHD